MEGFAKNSKPLSGANSFAKHSILDIWQGSECVFAMVLERASDINVIWPRKKKSSISKIGNDITFNYNKTLKNIPKIYIYKANTKSKNIIIK